MFNPARRHSGQGETSTTTVHLTIIQACFTLSSRVLLVSNLRRSNWKCTVKRFFKSTVMIVSDVRVRTTSHVTDRYHIGSKARHGCKVVFNHSSSVVLVLYHSRYVLVVLGSGSPTIPVCRLIPDRLLCIQDTLQQNN